MSAARAILEHALALPDDARAALALRLVESLSDASLDDGSDEAWADEILRRLDAVESDPTATTDAFDALDAVERDLPQLK